MWYKIQKQQITLQIIAKPQAKKTALLKVSEQGLHIAIHAKPHKGEANEALIAFLSQLFKVPKSHLILKSGKNSKYKSVILPLTTSIEKIINEIDNIQ